MFELWEEAVDLTLILSLFLVFILEEMNGTMHLLSCFF